MSLHVSELEMMRAAELIRSGQLVAFPTETVYGLGANALDSEAVRRIFEAKERPWASPLIVHVADEKMARTVSAEWPAAAQKLVRAFWPGPLTLVLKKAAIVPDLVTAGLDSVGVRMPSHPMALELIRRAGVPIAAPSANRFTQISPTTAEHVREGLDDRVEMILDGGPTTVGIESTVVALHRAPPAVLRPGIITQEELERVAGVRFEREMDLPHIVESPGQHPRHYAPQTPLVLLEADATAPNGRGRIIDMPTDPKLFASALYAELHKADREGWDWIAIRRPPETPEWAGILDRLERASAPQD
ncbi:MAG: threonylcarbamoyl-AMP synthase [Acidobacteriaceae bacterium]|nr:threonylcarbamoyl-AMP synthase [Acidobacteriaceae bacterium]